MRAKRVRESQPAEGTKKKRKRSPRRKGPVENPAPHLVHQNAQSRTRLDARLWLSCRLALVKAMLGEIRGLGQVKGED